MLLSSESVPALTVFHSQLGYSSPGNIDQILKQIRIFNHLVIRERRKAQYCFLDSGSCVPSRINHQEDAKNSGDTGPSGFIGGT